MTIHEITKHSALDFIKSLFDKTYTKIYLSFGSKYNERRVIYESPAIPDHSTNAPYQMLPAFLRDYSENEHILSICVDDFSNIENKLINKNIIGFVIKDTDDFVFVDWKLEIFDLYTFLRPFLKLLEENDIRSYQFYCVLYLKFIHPNPIEDNFSEKIEKLVNSIFKDSIYRNSLFIWFGYHPNLYNYIYPAYYSFANYAYNLTVIQKRFKYEHIDRYDIDSWVSILKPNEQTRMLPFLTNCYDITQYSNDGNLRPIYHSSLSTDI